MIIDDRGRLFGKINIADIAFLLVVAIAIAGVGYKLKKSKTVTPFVKEDAVVIEVYHDEVPDFVVKAIKNGDAAGDYERGTSFGKVVEVKSDKSRSYAQDSSGKYVTSSKDGLNAVTVKVEGSGIINKTGGVSIGNIDYFIGRTIIFKAGNCVFQGRISNIAKKG
ncbi:MAG: DUF4330 domain-containing protein [Clostridia bacterium]|nr:DUF4330 domain-containing protein [Clostridia bacterium]